MEFIFQMKWFEALNASDKGCGKFRVPRQILFEYLDSKRKNKSNFDLMVSPWFQPSPNQISLLENKWNMKKCSEFLFLPLFSYFIQ